MLDRKSRKSSRDRGRETHVVLLQRTRDAVALAHLDTRVCIGTRDGPSVLEDLTTHCAGYVGGALERERHVA